MPFFFRIDVTLQPSITVEVQHEVINEDDGKTLCEFVFVSFCLVHMQFLHLCMPLSFLRSLSTLKHFDVFFICIYCTVDTRHKFLLVSCVSRRKKRWRFYHAFDFFLSLQKLTIGYKERNFHKFEADQVHTSERGLHNSYTVEAVLLCLLHTH